MKRCREFVCAHVLQRYGHRRASSFGQFVSLGTTDVAKITNAQRNLLIWEQAEKPDYKVGIADLLDMARREQDLSTVLLSAQFLQKTLPPMLAKRIKDLQALPLPFQQISTSIGQMCALFEETFLYILHSKPATSKELEEEFSSLLLMAKAKYLETGQSEALKMVRCAGNGEWMDATGNLVYVDYTQTGKVQDLFSRFYTGRIGIRLLIDTHLALRRDVLGDTLSSAAHSSSFKYGDSPLSHADYQRSVWERVRQGESKEQLARKYYSVLHARCRILPLVALAVDDAKAATARHISGTCGNRVVEEMKVHFEGDLEIVLPMIPEHLYMITSEIIANALRVTAQRHSRTLGPHSTCLPPVTVTFSRGPDQFYLKISDRGGGVAFDDIQKIWKFSYSGTSLPPTRAVSTDSASTKTRVSQQGLSLSRLYARYWGGDITMASMENWGCDFLLRIPLVAHPGVQLILPDAMHDDPLSRGGCYKERCSYPYPFWKDQTVATATDGTSLFTAPL